MKDLQTIYDSGDGCFEQLVQFYKDGWKCEIDDAEVALSIVAMATDMMEATGEDEFKDYPIVPEVGILNKDCHPSISVDMAGDAWEGEKSDLYDVNGYCGMACYILESLLSTDKLNQNIQEKLTIEDACLKSYECRFTKETKYYPAFKTQEKCIDFLTDLIKLYGDSVMGLVGFHLDKPVNLIGETAWKTIELCKDGI